ncbi:Endo-type membrane-bound lytic murein transglycosylase A precursor [compost metagenome]
MEQESKNSKSYDRYNPKSSRGEETPTRKVTRREMIIGAAGLSLGALVAFTGARYDEYIRDQEALLLAPEYSPAEKSLVIDWLPDTVKRWEPQIEKYSNEYKIDPNLLAIMMTVESGGDPTADSGVAKGLMQITDPTAKDINERYVANKKTDYDLFNPDTSVEFGAAYVRYLIDQFSDSSHGPSWDETVSVVAAGYNGGQAAANLYLKNKWEGLESYDRQTLSYTRYVRVMWQERHDPLSFTYRYWHDTANGKALVDKAEQYRLP